jgi:NitT/TauT family transport system substrate-binding protein
MSNRSADRWSRREFLTTVAAAGTGAVLGLRSEAIAAEPPPETTKLRLIRSAPVCTAPQYIAEELLRGEGFSDIQEIRKEGGGIPARIQALGAGEGDILSTYIGPLLARIDDGDPIVILTGLHVGCLQLFATERIRTIRDLKGKTVAINEVGSAGHYFLASWRRTSV